MNVHIFVNETYKESAKIIVIKEKLLKFSQASNFPAWVMYFEFVPD